MVIHCRGERWCNPSGPAYPPGDRWPFEWGQRFHEAKMASKVVGSSDFPCRASRGTARVSNIFNWSVLGACRCWAFCFILIDVTVCLTPDRTRQPVVRAYLEAERGSFTAADRSIHQAVKDHLDGGLSTSLPMSKKAKNGMMHAISVFERYGERFFIAMCLGLAGSGPAASFSLK